MARVIVFIFALLPIGFGLWSSVDCVRALFEAATSMNWPHVEGHITSSSVKITATHGPRGGGYSYEPQITYSYRVDRSDYTGDIVMPGRMWGSKNAYATINRFAVGSVADVFYSQADPTRSMLEPGFHLVNCGRLVNNAIFICFGLFFLMVVVNVRPRGRNDYELAPKAKALVLTLFFLVFVFAGAAIWLSSI